MKNYIQSLAIMLFVSLVSACGFEVTNSCDSDDIHYHNLGHDNNVAGMRAWKRKKNVNPNAYCHKKGHHPAIMCAAMKGYTDVIKYLIEEEGVDPNVQPPQNDGSTPLIAASVYGYTSAVQALLRGGANPNTQNNQKQTALMVAAQNNHINVVKALLLATGVDIDAQNGDGWTALMNAAFRGHADVVKELCKADADPDIQDPTHGWTALMVAAIAGNTNAVKALIEGDADLDIRSTKGETAIFMAVYKGHKEVVKILARAGANAHVSNNTGWSPARIAFEQMLKDGDVEIFDILVKDGGIDVNAPM